MVEGVAPWKSFDEIEENLILDELLLLNEVMAQKKKQEINLQIALAGGDPPHDDDDIEDTDDDSGLPMELIEAEREIRRKRQAEEIPTPEPETEDEKAMRELSEVGFGYVKKTRS